jgi:hypothetical protein
MVVEIGVFVVLAVGYAMALRGSHVPDLVNLWANLGLAVGTVVLVERAIGKRPSEVGFDPRHAVVDGLVGVAVGAAMFGTVILVLFLASSYRIVAVAPSLLGSIALAVLAAAAIEEILMRGIVFRLLSQWAGTWIALALSAALFGALHLHNPGATWLAAAAIALEAGVLLAAAYVVTGNLWLPIGLHFAWNYLEGPIFGTQVSGGMIEESLFRAHISGPEALTGGRFGPEAGIVALIVGIAAAAAFLIYAHRRGLIVPCPWWRGTRAPSAETPSP